MNMKLALLPKSILEIIWMHCVSLYTKGLHLRKLYICDSRYLSNIMIVDNVLIKIMIIKMLVINVSEINFVPCMNHDWCQ